MFDFPATVNSALECRSQATQEQWDGMGCGGQAGWKTGILQLGGLDLDCVS